MQPKVTVTISNWAMAGWAASVVCRGTGLRIWRQLARLGSAGSSQSTQRNLWVRSWSPRRDSLLGFSGKLVWEALPALSSLWS